MAISRAKPVASDKQNLPQGILLPVNTIDRMKLLLSPSQSVAKIGLLPTSAPISKTPSSLLTSIYNEIEHPRDQIAFALACHCFGAIATSSAATPLKPGTVTTTRKTIEPYRKEHLLADLVSWGFIKAKSKRNPVKLCRSCWKYLPRQRIWKTKDGRRKLTSLKRVDWAWAVMLWAQGGGKVCPTCQIPEGYDDEVTGQFLQREGVGLGTHRMVVQSYEQEGGDDEC